MTIKISSARNMLFYSSIFDENRQYVVEYPTVGWINKKGTDVWDEIILKPNQWSDDEVFEPGIYIFYPETNLYDSPLSMTTTDPAKG